MAGHESRLHRLVSEIDDEDATSRYREERADNDVPEDSPGSASSIEDGRTLVAWLPDDPENPYNWNRASSASPVLFSNVS